MPDVARAAVDAPVDRAVDDDARADAGGDLDQRERRAVGVVGALLAVRHQVRVVVDVHRHRGGGARVLGEGAAESAPYVVAVPAGHDRRLHHAAGLAVDRARHGEPDAAHRVRVPAARAQQLAEPGAELVQDLVRALVDPQRPAALGDDLAGEREQGGAGVPGLQVGGEDDGVRVVELKADRGAAAERGRHRVAGALAQPARAEEAVEALADGGPGQAGDLLQGAAGRGAAAADQVEQVARAGPVGPASAPVLHAHSPCLPPRPPYRPLCSSTRRYILGFAC
ncbi:putative xylose repressor [Streptomyces aurantiacus JA 4570]|uniref:Putative xylose repressor n=1 Tax=Streptomyces aurantiacus JA 4570 TaxID=1286094 RepID=S4A1G1_9ACTN|nr:putative xylose repressor [Streptomyces aurantiacus JA 4570]